MPASARRAAESARGAVAGTTPFETQTQGIPMNIMKTKLPMSLVLLILLVAAVPLLGACNTMAGAGKDISRGGDAIERSAQKNAP
jgi:entericidin B